MRVCGALIMSLALWACNAREDQVSVDYRNVIVPVDQLASDEARERGRVLFRQKCALCHGVRADGNGVRREGLSARPANFQSREWQTNTDPLEVYATLREGKRGTSMPAWPTLSDHQTWDVVAYVMSVSEDRP